MTTQGDKKHNYNNHSFAGYADKNFAFAHNGVLYIIKIDRNGFLSRSEFKPRIYRSKIMGWYDEDEAYYSAHEHLLLAYCNCYGVDSSDVEMLLEYGYTCNEIEDMLADHRLITETINSINGEYDCDGWLF